MRRGLRINIFFQTITLILTIIVLCCVFYSKPIPEARAAGATRTWDGGGGADTKWSTCTNWSADTCPDDGDFVVFNNTSSNNSTVDAGYVKTPATISVNAGYGGTITQQKNFSTSGAVTINAGIWAVATYNLTINSGASNLTIGSTLTIGASAGTGITTQDLTLSGTLTCSGISKINIAGNYSNTGTFTAASSIVTFNSTASGKTLSGRLNNSITNSALYKVVFNGIGGGWTIQDAMKVSAANATDTFVIGNGTVTLGDGPNDNLEINGKLTIANTANQTGTLQTYANTQGNSLIVDLNNNAAPVACANCIITVGATAGTGQGNLKIRKNTIVRLNPSASTDTGIETESTGYLEIQGSQDYTGTSDGTTDETTITDSTKTWALDENNGKVVRMTSGLALGQIYDITDTTVTTITRADNSSASTTIASITTQGTEKTICTNANNLIAADNEGTGRYLHDTTHSGYFRIVDSTNDDTNCSSNDSFILLGDPDSLSLLANGDTINISDGVRQADAYEILDYAQVSASDQTCPVYTTSAYTAYIYSKAGSENKIQYADICNLGKDENHKYGISFHDVNGANQNEGFVVDKSRIFQNYNGIYLRSSVNNTGAKGITSNSVYFNNVGIYLFSSDNNTLSTNQNNNNLISIIIDSSNNNTLSANNNNNNEYGIEFYGSNNNTLSANNINNSNEWGMDFYSSSNNILSANINNNNWISIYLYQSNNNILSANINNNNGSGIALTASNNNILSANINNNNGSGIDLYISNNNTLSANINNNNGSGIFLSSSNNTIGLNDTNAGSRTYDIISANTGPSKLFNASYATLATPGQGYELTNGKTSHDVVGFTYDSMNNGTLAVFYTDGTYASTSSDYDVSGKYAFFPATYHYSLAPGKTSDMIVGFTEEGRNIGKIAVFYNDGTYSVSADTWAADADVSLPTLYNYTLAPGYSYADIIGIEQDSWTTGRLGVFYNDGHYSTSAGEWDADADVSVSDIHSYTLAAGKTASDVVEISSDYWWDGKLAVWYNDYSYSLSLGSWDVSADVSVPDLTDSSIIGSVISQKDNGNSGQTKIYGNYTVPSDNLETPQNESIDKYKYAENSWEKSATAHGYSGTGTEDTNLDYDLSSADLSGGPYVYRLTVKTAGACNGTAVFDVFRDETDVGDMTCNGTVYTDANGDVNVKFKVQGGGPAAYVVGDTYTFVVFDASDDANVTKSVTMVGDSAVYDAGAGTSLESIGDATHRTTWTREGGAGGARGYNINVNGGTLNAQYTDFNYLKGPNGLDIGAGSTVTSLDNTKFDNLIDSGANDAFIRVASSVIGAVNKTLTGVDFANSNGAANYNVNRNGADDTGYWYFTPVSGALYGESKDALNGAADEPSPGMLRWDPHAPTNFTGQVTSSTSITYTWTNQEPYDSLQVLDEANNPISPVLTGDTTTYQENVSSSSTTTRKVRASFTWGGNSVDSNQTTTTTYGTSSGSKKASSNQATKKVISQAIAIYRQDLQKAVAILRATTASLRTWLNSQLRTNKYFHKQSNVLTEFRKEYLQAVRIYLNDIHQAVQTYLGKIKGR